MTSAKTTTKPAPPSIKILRALCDSSHIELSPKPLRKEFEEKLAAKDGSGGLRFSFSQLDESKKGTDLGNTRLNPRSGPPMAPQKRATKG